jgi:threonine/homoserine/homoserine lactone efflux protein
VFTLLQCIGAAYLLWLGANLLLRPRDALADGAAALGTVTSAFRQGLLTNLLNPKIGVFYLTFLVQFVPAGVSVPGFVFLLACIHVALGLAWFAVLIGATLPLARVLRRPQVVRTLDRATGAVFVLFGLRLALAPRP